MLTVGAMHHQTPRAARKGPALQDLVPHRHEGNAGELTPRTAALRRGESALPRKSQAALLSQLMAIRVVMSVPGNPVANPAGAPEQGEKQQSPGPRREEENGLHPSPRAAGKPRERGRACARQLEGRLNSPLKLGKRFLAAAATSRVFNTSG